jgi:hypothetical protein
VKAAAEAREGDELPKSRKAAGSNEWRAGNECVPVSLSYHVVAETECCTFLRLTKMIREKGEMYVCSTSYYQKHHSAGRFKWQGGPGIWYYGGIGTSYWDTVLCTYVVLLLLFMPFPPLHSAATVLAFGTDQSRIGNWTNAAAHTKYSVFPSILPVQCPQSHLSPPRPDQSKDFSCVATIKITITTPYTETPSLSNGGQDGR